MNHGHSNGVFRKAVLVTLSIVSCAFTLLPSHAAGIPWTVVGVHYKFVPSDQSLEPAGLPSILQIGKDDTLTLHNMDPDEHSLTADLRVCPATPDCKEWQRVPVFDSRPVRPSESGDVNFLSFIREQAGTYSFHCMFHVDMRGTLTLR
jgi:plastocyanin